MRRGDIALRGGAWWAGIGTAKSTGTKIHSISGDCGRPASTNTAGARIAMLVDAARDTQAVQVGGPSGTCLSVSEFGRRIAFEDVPTAGALMVFDRSRDMFEVARNFAHFFAHESCGFCTPCRVGTALLANRMDKLANGAVRLRLRRNREAELPADAVDEPLRPGRGGLQPGARHHRQFRPPTSGACEVDFELPPAFVRRRLSGAGPAPTATTRRPTGSRA